MNLRKKILEVFEINESEREAITGYEVSNQEFETTKRTSSVYSRESNTNRKICKNGAVKQLCKQCGKRYQVNEIYYKQDYCSKACMNEYKRRNKLNC